MSRPLSMHEGSDVQDSLRRAVLSQVREIKELKAALDEERAKSAALEARVAALELELKRDREGKQKEGAKTSPRENDAKVSPRENDAKPTSQDPSKPSPREEQVKASPRPVASPRNASSPRVASVRGKKGDPIGVASSLEEKEEPKKEEPIIDESAIQASDGPGASSEVILDYASAVLVLRLLERVDVAQLGKTCKGWHALCKPYLSEWRRTRLVLELGDTERTYVAIMRGIVESYVRPGQVGSKFLDDQESFALFANTEDLFLLHRELYKQLRETLYCWTSSSCISDVFQILSEAPELYRVYSSNQTEALAFAEQLRCELRIADNDWRKLESFLICPIQRIPRYQMLLREITSNTKEGHREHESAAKAQQLLSSIGREMEKGMEMAATAKFGAEMLAQMSDVPAWMGAGLLKCEKYAECKRGEKALRRTAKLTDCFIMLCGSVVVLAECKSSLRKTAAASTSGSASVAAPLGKGCAALEKQWKFIKHFSRDVLKVSVVTETALSVGTSDADSVHLQFETFQEANSWLATLTLRKK